MRNTRNPTYRRIYAIHILRAQRRHFIIAPLIGRLYIRLEYFTFLSQEFFLNTLQIDPFLHINNINSLKN